MISQEQILQFLYGTKGGRVLLSVLVRPGVSKAVGCLLNQKISCVLIPGFIRRNRIDLTQFENKKYDSYNDFFTRKIKKGKRPFPTDMNAFVAPCDSRLSVYPINQDAEFIVKGTRYTMNSLLRSEKLAKRYEGGTLLIFRLSVDDYHRYSYVDSGKKSKNYRIPGVFHTVNPIAGEKYPIYKENTREFSLLKSEHFGTILMMEVGAMLVGKIVNHDQKSEVKRGQEKGYFEFGGSTVILCLQNGTADIDQRLINRTNQGLETKVRLGEVIGHKHHK